MLKLLNSLKFLKVFKNTEFKILTINLGVVAAIREVGVRGDPCGAMRWTLKLKKKLCQNLRVPYGSTVTSTLCILTFWSRNFTFKF